MAHFRGSSFQNFPGGAYPRTPLVARVPPCIESSARHMAGPIFLLATPLVSVGVFILN